MARWPPKCRRRASSSKARSTYGVAATFAPFEFQKDGVLTGFDIDMIEAIAKKLGATPKPMNMEFQGLIPALLGGRLDLINSAMYMNEKRAEQVDFIPYMKIGELVIVKAGNPSGITGRDDSLCGKTISTTLGAIEETYAREDAERCKAAGKGEVTVQTLPTGPDTVTSVLQGRADAMYTSTPGAAVMLDELAGQIEVAGAEFELDHLDRHGRPQGRQADAGRDPGGPRGDRRRRHLCQADRKVEAAADGRDLQVTLVRRRRTAVPAGPPGRNVAPGPVRPVAGVACEGMR